MTTTKIWKTNIPRSLEEVWDFFLRSENLEKITPIYMNFENLTESKEPLMYEGMIIKYKVSPFAILRINWATEITKIEEMCYFVDEQRIGPYRMWHHEHHFKKIDDSNTEMIDILNYNIGKGLIGVIANKLFVEKKIDEIFDFRYKTFKEYFK